MSDGPDLLRMLKRGQATQVREWIDHPERLRFSEMISILVHTNPAAAQELVDLLLIRRCRQAGPTMEEELAFEILTQDRFFQALPHGTQLTQNTEVGQASLYTDPDYRTYRVTWDRYRARALEIMRGAGATILCTAPKGKGKSHLAHLFSEVALEGGLFVVFNMGMARDRTHRFDGRMTHAGSLSGILRAWAEAEEGTRFFVVIDEPAATLRAGFNNNVRHWGLFQHILRKLGITTMELWQEESEIYKTLRDSQSDGIYRIRKTEQKSFSIHNTGPVTYVDELPALDFLEFETRGLGTIEIDIDLAALQTRFSNVPEHEMRSTMRLVLDDPDVYLANSAVRRRAVEEERLKRREERSRAKKERLGFLDQVRAAVLRQPSLYCNQLGHVSPELVRARHPDLTWPEAKAVAQEVNQRPWRTTDTDDPDEERDSP